MVVKCERCHRFFDDEYRSTLCPHDAFPANDGRNNFAVHNDSYLAAQPPTGYYWTNHKEET